MLPTPVKTEKKKKPMTKDEDLFADDTDIFADIPKPKAKEPKKKKKTTAAPKKTIFKDDIGKYLFFLHPRLMFPLFFTHLR